MFSCLFGRIGMISDASMVVFMLTFQDQTIIATVCWYLAAAITY